MKQAKLIFADGTEKTISPKNGTDFSLQECYKHIGCDIIEMIQLENGDIMIVDEEFRFRDDNKINYVASKLFMQGRMSAFETSKKLREIYGENYIYAGTGDPESDESILGTVIVCSPDMFL